MEGKHLSSTVLVFGFQSSGEVSLVYLVTVNEVQALCLCILEGEFLLQTSPLFRLFSSI